MSDYIGGYPSKVTVSGNNISWAAGEFDKIVFGKYGVGAYVANVSLGTPASQQITAVPGVQEDGSYMITVDDASGWSTDDRCTPQAQETVYWYTAGNTAIANMAMNDRLLLWYYDTDNSRNHFWTSGTQAKGFSISGMAPLINITGSRTLNSIYMVGNLSAQTEIAVIENIHFGVASICIYYSDSSNSSAGMRITRCCFCDQTLGAYINTGSALATPGQIDNCLFVNCQNAIGGKYNKYYFNTIIGSQLGFNYNQDCIIQNCLAKADVFAYYTSASVLDVLSNDLANDAEDNIIHFDSLTELGLWSDGVRWNFVNPRIVETSIAYEAGNVITGALDTTNLYVDFDGNDRNETTPSIGFHEGTATAYPTGEITIPTAPTITGITAGDGTLTVTVAATSETDAIYVRFRQTGTTVWNTESGSYARTGSGTVAISGLTNGKSYQVSAYAKDGYTTSDWATNCYAVPGVVRTIIDVADEIKTVVADLELSQSITPERVYIQHMRLETITDTKVWVQPIEQVNSALTRNKDRNDYTVDVAIFKRCENDADVDEMIVLANEIYRGLRNHTYGSNQKTINVETPTIFSPDFLNSKKIFGAVITVNIMDETP